MDLWGTLPIVNNMSKKIQVEKEHQSSWISFIFSPRYDIWKACTTLKEDYTLDWVFIDVHFLQNDRTTRKMPENIFLHTKYSDKRGPKTCCYVLFLMYTVCLMQVLKFVLQTLCCSTIALFSYKLTTYQLLIKTSPKIFIWLEVTWSECAEECWWRHFR